jgi:SsrA-binding protein
MATHRHKPSARQSTTIALNKKARHDYSIIRRMEAGMVLAGWEVKSLRAGKAQLVDSYVLLKDGEALLLGALFQPLDTVSTHVVADPTRTRKLLLHKKEINQLMGQVKQKGLSVVALALYWKANRVKCEIALVKGKKLYDKRASEKERDWNRDRQRILRHSIKSC